LKKKEYTETQKKLVISIVHILILSTIISYISCNIFIYHGLAEQFNADIDEIADKIVLMADNDVIPQDILKIVASPVYPVRIVGGINDYDLTSSEYGSFTKNGIVKFKETALYSTILLQKNGTIFEITVNPKTNDFVTTLLRIGLAMLLAFLISVIIAIAGANALMKPIRDLSKAVLKISKGDFSARVKPSKNPEINQLAENFNFMAKELDKMDTLSNDFIRNVSHEFKTPVSSLCGFAELLKQSELTPQQRDYANIIDAEARRLSKLTSSILSLSKLENQSIIAEKQKFYIDEQLRQCILLLEKQWTEKNINLEIYLDKAEFYGNKLLTENVWINLIDNAIKYTPENGEIIVSCTKDNNSIIVSVKDNGIGMTDEVVERIFDKFYQGDSSHSQEGNGLGLAIVKKIIDISNGTIEVDSKEGKGTVFVVTLPVEKEK